MAIVRILAIRAAVQQFGLILDTLKETRFVCSNEVVARALGLYFRTVLQSYVSDIGTESHRTTRVLK